MFAVKTPRPTGRVRLGLPPPALPRADRTGAPSETSPRTHTQGVRAGDVMGSGEWRGVEGWRGERGEEGRERARRGED